MTPNNFYELLEIEVLASDEEIRQAYYKKAKQVHPDVSAAGAETFHLIQQAYKVLLNPKSRAKHDRELGIMHRLGFSEGAAPKETSFSITKWIVTLRKIFSNFLSAAIGVLKTTWSKIAEKLSRKNKLQVEQSNLIRFPGSIRFAIDTEETLPFLCGEPIKLESLDESSETETIYQSLCSSLPVDITSNRAALARVVYIHSQGHSNWLLQLETPDNDRPIPDEIELLCDPNIPKDLILCWSNNGDFSQAVWKAGRPISLCNSQQKAI